MAGFATYADLKQALADQHILTRSFGGAGTSGSGLGPWIGYWTTMVRPTPGSAPASTPGTAYTNATGGIVFPDTSPNLKYLIRSLVTFETGNSDLICIKFVDRLVGVGGLVLTSTGNKTVNSTALPRYTDGGGVEAWLEVSTAGSTTAATVSMNSYTNQDNQNARAGGSISFATATQPANALLGPLPLQAGDTGVKSVETINVSVAAGGSATVNLILVKPLFMHGLNGVQDRRTERSWPLPYIHPIRFYDGATIMMIQRNCTNNTTEFRGSLTVVEG